MTKYNCPDCGAVAEVAGWNWNCPACFAYGTLPPEVFYNQVDTQEVPEVVAAEVIEPEPIIEVDWDGDVEIEEPETEPKVKGKK